MKITGDYRFEAPRETVWQALQDPEVLAAVLPGCEKLELVGENAYEGALKIKVGPVQGAFQGKVQLSDLDPPNGYTMNVDGRGQPGFVKATAQVRLAEDGDGTLMTYDSDAQVGGRIASVGQRLLDSSARAIIKQSLEGLNEVMKSRTAAPAADPGGSGEAGEGAGPAAAAPPPKPLPKASQAEFAANVAKEVAKDLIPKPVLIAVVILVLLIVLYLIFGR